VTVLEPPEVLKSATPSDGSGHAREGRERGWSVSRRWGLAAGGLLLLAQNLLLAFGAPVPLLISISGFACAVGMPTFILYMADVGRAPAQSERLANSVILTLLLLMAAGLAINTVLPHLGVRGPLGPVPVVLTVDALCVGLALWGYRRHPTRYHVRWPTLSSRDHVVLFLSLGAVPLSVTGAVRLNNGAGGGLTLFMLMVVLVTFGLALAWRDQLHAGIVPVVIYCLALALLLMTSMRGWYTTGHDNQVEFQVFELAKSHDRWDISLYQDAYNACLSITILPTILWQWTRVPDPYVFKIFFQVLFALCPVLVYRIATRVASRTVALLGAIYFVAFVTFFQDMPMLNRQETAFLFVAAALLAAFNTGLPMRWRRVWFVVFALGMVLSHYSTTFVMIGVLVIAWCGRVVAHTAGRVRRRRAATASPTSVRELPASALGLGTIGIVALAIFLWTTPLTHTEGTLSQTVSAVVTSLRGGVDGAKSADTAYSIFSSGAPTPAELLASYERTSLRQTAAERAAGAYYSEHLLARYPTPPVPDATLPLTRLGKSVSDVGVNAGAVIFDVRQASSWLLQVFIALGLLVSILGRHKRLRNHPDFFSLAVANVVVLILLVALPVLSVNYGLLRAFQQCLLILDVFLVIGTLALFPRLGEGKKVLGAGSLALLFFASSTGALTQVLGGYGPQLHLNNAGLYYDIYYVHPEEIAGITWLHRTIGAGTHKAVQSEVEMDRFAIRRLRTFTAINPANDILPALVRRNSYVFLGYSNVRASRATIEIDGDLVTYRYPLNFLNDNKDLIYDNGGARVYR
jgi:uncharacterized membrane protein